LFKQKIKAVKHVSIDGWIAKVLAEVKSQPFNKGWPGKSKSLN